MTSIGVPFSKVSWNLKESMRFMGMTSIGVPLIKVPILRQVDRECSIGIYMCSISAFYSIIWNFWYVESLNTKVYAHCLCIVLEGYVETLNTVVYAHCLCIVILWQVESRNNWMLLLTAFLSFFFFFFIWIRGESKLTAFVSHLIDMWRV